MLWQNIIKI